jgi:hypothetical protein
MKRILILIILTILFNSIHAQDKIVKLNGDTITCRVSEITDDNIKYRYEGEDVLNNISKNIVKQIVFNSGRVQEFSKRIIINGVDDWQKVQITNLESDIEGLTKHKILTKKAKGTTFTSQGKVERRVMDKIKKEAAANGCHIVLILTTTGKSGTPYSSASSSISVIAYKY